MEGCEWRTDRGLGFQLDGSGCCAEIRRWGSEGQEQGHQLTHFTVRMIRTGADVASVQVVRCAQPLGII